MASTKLLYDNCQTKDTDRQNLNMLNWILDVRSHEHDKRCHHKLGIVGGVQVQDVKRNLVDLESELRGQYHYTSKCPEDKHSYENNGIKQQHVDVKQKYCRAPRKVKTQFNKMKDCQMIDFHNVTMNGTPNV